MAQTIVMVIALLVVGAVIQTNMALIHTQTPLTLPSYTSLPISYLRLLLAVGAAGALVWLAGMLDLAILHSQLRRRDAAVLAVEQDLMRFKATAYDQQQPALNELGGRLEGAVHELRGILARVEGVLRGVPDRISREEAATGRSERTARPEAVTAAVGTTASREDPGELEEVGAQPRKRWPL